MRSLILVLLITTFCSCNMTARNYYPDKIGDTALYVGKLHYEDHWGSNKDFKDTAYVIRLSADSIKVTYSLIDLWNDERRNIFFIEQKAPYSRKLKINESKVYTLQDSTDKDIVETILFDASQKKRLYIKYKRIETLGEGKYLEHQFYGSKFWGERAYLK